MAVMANYNQIKLLGYKEIPKSKSIYEMPRMIRDVRLFCQDFLSIDDLKTFKKGEYFNTTVLDCYMQLLDLFRVLKKQILHFNETRPAKMENK